MISDNQLTQEVVHALLWDARVSPASIEVSTKDGVVSLSGTVDSNMKKWSARETAFRVAGVEDVIDTIMVKPKAKLSDRTIQKNIKRVVENDTRLDGTNIQVSVKKGVVKVKGEVNSLFQKFAVEETCRWVRGATHVKNHIEVVPSAKVIDSEIKQEIERLLAKNRHLQDCKITVTVENQVVGLAGDVVDREQKALAEAIASMVANVSFVRNEIKKLQ